MPHKERPKAIDFFCGAGGFSLGFIEAGFDVVAAVDWDEHAAITYMANLGSRPIDIHFIDDTDKDRLEKAIQNGLKRNAKANNGIVTSMPLSGSGWISHRPDRIPVKHFWMGDVRKLSGQEILDILGLGHGDIDCVFGGPPCQGFSTSGKRDVMDPRNSLVFDFARLILEIQPKSFVMENVPGILSMITPEGIPVEDAFCKILSDGGFGGFDALKKTLLNTAGAGAALKGQSSGKRGKEKPMAAKEEQLALF